MNCIGIDLGTCLSSVAIMENGIPVALNVETASSQLIGNDRAVPSSVFIEEDGNIILGQKADNLRLKNPSRYRKEFKRDLGTTDPYHIGNHEFLPEDLYREFFKYFKKKAEERLSAQVDKAVITHPANFAGYKKEMIKKAAEMAGITQVELIDEPTAAAIYYATKEKIEDREKLLVYDLGGGTFDVSLIVKEGDSFRALTPPLGIERCGGVDFQRKIYEDVIDKFSNELMPILSKRDRLSKQLSSMIEAESIKLKHNLSFSDKAETAIMIPGTFDFSNYEIQRSKFEKMIKEYIDATCRKIEDIVKNADIKMSDIDRVLLVGGSSRIPYVEEMVKKTTGKPVYKDIDTELVVCYGAVVSGNKKRKRIDTLENKEKLISNFIRLLNQRRENLQKKDTSNDTKGLRICDENSKEEIAKQQVDIKVIAGDYILFGCYRNDPILWKCVKKEDDGCIMLVSEHILCLKSYDAAESGLSGLCLRTGNNVEKEGSSDWSSSNIREWLNSNSQIVNYSTQPPTKAAVWQGYNPYYDESGFLYNFRPEEKELIKSVYHEGVTDRIFLLSISEIGYIGTCANDRIKYVTKRVADSRVYSGDAKNYIYDNGACWYWTRTRKSASYVYAFTGSGTLYDGVRAAKQFGILPALYLSTDVCKSGEGIKEKPFRMI